MSSTSSSDPSVRTGSAMRTIVLPAARLGGVSQNQGPRRYFREPENSLASNLRSLLTRCVASI